MQNLGNNKTISPNNRVVKYYQLIWWRKTLYCGQFTLSTQLIILDYPVTLYNWCSTTVSLEPYPLYSYIPKLLLFFFLINFCLKINWFCKETFFGHSWAWKALEPVNEKYSFQNHFYLFQRINSESEETNLCKKLNG